MITVLIRYIALVAKDDANNGARVVFPSEGHGLTILLERPGESPQELDWDSSITFEVHEGGHPKNFGRPKGLPMKGRVFSPSRVNARPDPYTVKRDVELLAGPAQAILFVHGGKFTALDPSIQTSSYKDVDWNVGKNHKPMKLTDQVIWEFPVTGPGQTYSLNIDGVRTPLLDGDVVKFLNEDEPNKYFYDNGNGEVELVDVHAFYRLFVEPVQLRPTPKTPYKGPIITPTRRKKATPMGGGDLPLCPVGEP